MRSIGEKNKVIVKKVTEKVMCQIDGINAITEEVISRLPEKIFNTWECAYSEIVNIIEDTVIKQDAGR